MEKIVYMHGMYFEVKGREWIPIEETDETSDKYDKNIRLSYTALSRLILIDELDKPSLKGTEDAWFNRIQLDSENCLHILSKMGCKSERLINKIKNER